VEDVSLHLSFLATAGIVYLSEPLRLLMSRYIPRASLAEVASVTCAAYISTLPYVMHTFGSASPYSLVANMLVLPLVPAAMLLSSGVVMASFVSAAAASALGYAASLLLNAIILVARIIQGFPFSTVDVTVPLEGMYFLYAMIIVVVSYLARKRQDETFQTTADGYMTDIIKY
jgi:competence protein ComEC